MLTHYSGQSSVPGLRVKNCHLLEIRRLEDHLATQAETHLTRLCAAALKFQFAAQPPSTLACSRRLGKLTHDFISGLCITKRLTQTHPCPTTGVSAVLSVLMWGSGLWTAHSTCHRTGKNTRVYLTRSQRNDLTVSARSS